MLYVEAVFMEKISNKMATFWDNLTFWNIGNFVVKNLCEKVSKINNLSWQFRWIFHQLCHGVLHFSVDTFSMEKFANQNGHFSTFWDNLTLWNKGNFVVENLCDKVSKIKNLSWQFRWIFRRLCHGVIHFFCRHFFHG